METNSVFFLNLKKLINNGDLYIKFKEYPAYLALYLYMLKEDKRSFLINAIYYLFRILWNDFTMIALCILLSIFIKWYVFIFVYIAYVLINNLILNILGKGLLTSKMLKFEDTFDDMYEAGNVSIAYINHPNKEISFPQNWVEIIDNDMKNNILPTLK